MIASWLQRNPLWQVPNCYICTPVHALLLNNVMDQLQSKEQAYSAALSNNFTAPCI